MRNAQTIVTEILKKNLTKKEMTNLVQFDPIYETPFYISSK